MVLDGALLCPISSNLDLSSCTEISNTGLQELQVIDPVPYMMLGCWQEVLVFRRRRRRRRRICCCRRRRRLRGRMHRSCPSHCST